MDNLDYGSYLPQLEHLRALMERYMPIMYTSTPESQKLSQEICVVYGEVQPVIDAVVGRSDIQVEVRGGVFANYPNLTEAGFLSSRTFHTHEGYTQLLKVVGRVRSLGNSKSPAGTPRQDQSAEYLMQIMRRFRECCKYLQEPPADEPAVQDILWIMIRSQFDLVDREDIVPKFGVKNYKPDFGIPELRTLIEVKYVGEKTQVASIQEEIIADVPGYLSESSPYERIVVFVYDAAHKLLDPKRFIEDLRSIRGIAQVLVIPGIG